MLAHKNQNKNKFMFMTFCNKLVLMGVFWFNIGQWEVWARDSSELFLENIQNSIRAIQNYDYEQAVKHLNSAEILYRRALQEFTRAGESPSDVWKLNLAMQTNLIGLYLMVGNRFFDQDKFAQAMQMYNKAEVINPHFPCIHYEKANAYFQQNEKWKAAIEAYEAKRLANFPVYRKIVNHFDDEGSIVCPKEEIDTRGDILLKDLGKPINYPVELDLKTGKQIANQIVPGVGVNLSKRKQNIYLGMSLDLILDQLGEPLSYQGETTTERNETLKLMVYDNPRLVLGVDTNREQLKQIHLFEPGSPVKTPVGQFRIGEHASAILENLGQGFGFSRIYQGINEDIREYLDYSELGLVFGVAKNDKIVTIGIYNLE